MPSNEKTDVSIPRLAPRLYGFILILAVILFATAGRWDWAMGWAYMGMYGCVTAISIFAVPLDRELVEERTRIKEGVKDWDKAIAVTGSALYPLAILVVAGLDARFGWSPWMSLGLQLAALVLGALGNLVSTWAMSVNRFYSRFVRIQRERGHTVVTGGPYRYVRHPGYVGQMVFSLASPLALGSLWALIPGGLFALLLVVRTALEDRTLIEELPGYQAYAQRTRYRLLPGVW